MHCDDPLRISTPKAHALGKHYIPVPCGRCPNCLERRVNDWTFRLVQEEKYSTAAAFVTLTYDTREVPITDNGYLTLDKTDLQKYFKRLRKRLYGSAKGDLKYYAVGEYGGTRGRPHYHVILLNVSDQNAIAEEWNKGAVHIGTVTGESISYTLKYINKPPAKKWFGKNDDRKKEFSLMSKGLGEKYVNKQTIQYHTADLSRNYVVQEGGYRQALPKYYRNRILTDGQKAIQRKIIDKSIEEKEKDMERQFNLTYPKGDYEEWKDKGRSYRSDRFYNRAKNRDKF